MTNKVYEIITNKIIEQLQSGKIAWKQPWTSADAPRNIRGTRYHGVNVWMLNAERSAKNYSRNIWLTPHQAIEMGGNFAGQKTSMVVKWTIYDREDKSGKTEKFFSLSYYNVFNISQVSGITVPEDPETVQIDPIEAAETIVLNMPNAPKLTHGGSEAYFSPTTDTVNLPQMNDFHTAHGYYSVLFHELGHSTGHTSRLNRWKADHSHRFGSEDYSKEELIAEMTAAFITGEIGISREEDSKNTAAYIQSWIAALKNDVTMIVNASAAAEKAANYIMARQPAAE